jgi:hypothetical protein
LSDLLKEPEKSSLSLPGEKTKKTKQKKSKKKQQFFFVTYRIGWEL